jgi:hypothetical protein
MITRIKKIKKKKNRHKHLSIIQRSRGNRMIDFTGRASCGIQTPGWDVHHDHGYCCVGTLLQKHIRWVALESIKPAHILSISRCSGLVTMITTFQSPAGCASCSGYFTPCMQPRSMSRIIRSPDCSSLCIFLVVCLFSFVF